jgi:hypothetical protein
MATWRNCPEENPCQRIIAHDPACAGVVSSSLQPASSTTDPGCERAQMADYSCAALQQDRMYLLIQHKEASPECHQAKTDLAKFDNDIERVRLQIQWYRSLTGQDSRH